MVTPKLKNERFVHLAATDRPQRRSRGRPGGAQTVARHRCNCSFNVSKSTGLWEHLAAPAIPDGRDHSQSSHSGDRRHWRTGRRFALSASDRTCHSRSAAVPDAGLQERACGKRAVPGGSPSQRCIDSSQPDEVGAGKSGSAKQPTAMPQWSGLRSPSQKTLLPQFGQK